MRDIPSVPFLSLAHRLPLALALAVALGLGPLACSGSSPGGAPTASPAAPAAPAALTEPPQLADDPHGARLGVGDPQLAQLLFDSWEDGMRRYPIWATNLGDKRYDDRLSDNSRAGQAEGREQRRRWLQRVRDIDAAGLNPQDLLTRRLFVRDLQDKIGGEVCKFDDWSVSPRGNAVVSIARLPDRHKVESVEDGQNLVARYQAAPAWIDNEVTNLRVGLAEGRVATGETLRRVVAQLDEFLAVPVEEAELLAPLRAEYPDWTPKARDWFYGELNTAVVDGILPASTRYRDFVRDELLPAGRGPEASGVGSLPDGATCYGALVRRYTTQDHPADWIHARGLAELESIHAEFAVLGQRALGISDRAALFDALRTDPKLYFETAEQVQAKAESSLQAAIKAMPRAFGRLPEAECTVRPVPAYEAPFTTIAYYRRPAPDGSKPGEYFVNTHAPETRPRYEAAVLAYHEAIPGHHLQLSIAQQLPELPAFRRFLGATAFVEGWGLYSERLADELGLYEDDLDRLGMLSFDAWRAARLVVDTGLHHLGWSRQQAIDFLDQNTPLALNNIDNEVDRYIGTPGQALAYKSGQLEILALRAEAEARLGERFDLAAFHDTVLGGGALPLPQLRERVEAWLELAATAPAPPKDQSAPPKDQSAPPKDQSAPG